MPSRSSRGSSTTIAIRRTFAGLFGLTPPVVPWPRIGFADAETEVALPMVCSACDGRVVLDARSRSLQLAFLIPIVDAYHDSKVAIRALHYLYYLVVARKHGVHVFELSQELPRLLRPGGAFEKVVESFTLVPEVLELYRNCQVVHAELDVPAD